MTRQPLLIKNAVIVTGDNEKPFSASMLIKYENDSGTIAAIGSIPESPDYRAADAGGDYILPSFTDIGCHFYESAHPLRESVASGSAAAIAGGYSTLLCEPSEEGEMLPYDVSAFSRLRLVPIQKIPSPIRISQLGKSIYSDGGKWISDSLVMRETMLACAETDSVLISTCADQALIGSGVMASGQTAKLLSLPTIPQSAETVALSRDIILAEETGCHIHFRAISSARSVQMVRGAKKRGIKITCGVSPLSLAMTDSDIVYYGSLAKVMPPLRSENDRSALISGLIDGTIDCVSSLHTPLTRNEKTADMRSCPFGASGFETAFPALMTYLVKNKLCDIQTLARVMSVNPSAILGIDSRIRVGAPATFTIVSPDKEIVVSSNTLKSKGSNTPFMGLSLYGSVFAVFRNGIQL